MACSVGYARVSTLDQNLDLQRDALHKAGCEHIYTDTLCGSAAQRPGVEECLKYLWAGDTIVVWKLDRLGRSLKHRLEAVQVRDERGISFKSLQESIDITTPGGKLVFHVFAALAEFHSSGLGEARGDEVGAVKRYSRYFKGLIDSQDAPGLS